MIASPNLMLGLKEVSYMNTPKMWMIEEIASMLHVFPDTIRRAIETGELCAVEKDGDYVITEENMKEFMKSGNPFQRVTAPTQAA
jgi:hypothetical protein